MEGKKGKKIPPIQQEQHCERPASKLMRVPLETYALIAEWADKDRRHMNQELAVIVEEWVAARRWKNG